MLKIGIVLLCLSFSLLSLLAYEALGVSCKCIFDTYEYTAVAEGEGYCSCTTKGGKHCSIVFNGNVKPTSKIEPSKYYGSVETYLAHLIEIKRGRFYLLRENRMYRVAECIGSRLNIQQVNFLRENLRAVLKNDRILSVRIERLKKRME